MEELPHLRRRRTLAAVLGMIAFVGLVAVMAGSVLGPGPHLGFGRSRLGNTWSDWGVLATLVIAAPVVLYAFYVHLRRK